MKRWRTDPTEENFWGVVLVYAGVKFKTYPPVENLLDLIYEHYTENNPVEKNTVAGKVAKAKEKELEEWLRGLDGMDRLVDDYVGDKIPLWEKIMNRQGTVCCTWEKTAFEEYLKVGIRLMMEVYSLRRK